MSGPLCTPASLTSVVASPVITTTASAPALRAALAAALAAGAACAIVIGPRLPGVVWLTASGSVTPRIPIVAAPARANMYGTRIDWLTALCTSFKSVATYG